MCSSGRRAGSSIFDDNEAQAASAHSGSGVLIDQATVCTPFDFSSFSVHASLASVGDGLSTALVLEMHLRA